MNSTRQRRREYQREKVWRWRNSSRTNPTQAQAIAPLIGHVLFTNGSTLRLARTNQYDALNRLTNLTWNVAGTNVASFAYQYNSANQRTRATLLDGTYWAYEYDALGQVTSAKRYWSDDTPVAGQQSAFSFDDIGNRRTAAQGGDQAGNNLHVASYGATLLNQYTSRTVPGFVSVLGTASNTATVTLWGDNGAYAATSRKGDYFRGELYANNATGKRRERRGTPVMARKLRLEYAGAIYHLMNRGDRREPIVRDKVASGHFHQHL